MYIQNPGLQILEFIVFIWQMYTSLKHRETLTEEFLSPSVSNDVFPPVLFPQNDAEHLLSVSHGAAVSGHLWIHRLWQQLHDPTSYGLMTCTQKKNTPLEVWRNEYSAAFSASSLLCRVWKCILSYSVCCFSIPEEFNQPLQCFKFKILMLQMHLCVCTDVFLLLLLFVRDQTGQVFYMKTFLKSICCQDAMYCVNRMLNSYLIWLFLVCCHLHFYCIKLWPSLSLLLLF